MTGPVLPTSRTDARLTALYERHGARFIVWHLVGVYLIVVVVGILGGAVGSRAAQLRLGPAIVATGAVELSLAVAIAWATWAVRAEIGTMMRWASSTGPRDQRTREEIIPAVFRFSPHFAGACLWRVVLVTPLTSAVAFGLRGPHGGPGFAVLIGLTSLVFVLYGGVAGAFLGQLSLRPIRREAGHSLTREEFAPLRSFSVATKVRLGFISGLLIVSFTIQAITLPFATESSIARAFGLSLLIVATLGLTLALPVTQNALDPVRDLISGTHRVAAGDLSTEVPVTSTDELGELAASFNEMLEGLREREHFRDELRASRARIVAAADAERRRVERDLHDGAQQLLVLLSLKLGLLARAAGTDPALCGLVEEVREDAARALTELRDLAHGIYPLLLENEGLPGALREATERAAIPTTFDCGGTGRYRSELETAVYFCCLEALQNAAKHAGEDACASVAMAECDGALEFVVSDDGLGFDAARTPSSAGLQNMADRIGALGGSLTIRSAPGGGTTLRAWVPLGAT